MRIKMVPISTQGLSFYNVEKSLVRYTGAENYTRVKRVPTNPGLPYCIPSST
jgi:hypothetical protein